MVDCASEDEALPPTNYRHDINDSVTPHCSESVLRHSWPYQGQDFNPHNSFHGASFFTNNEPACHSQAASHDKLQHALLWPGFHPLTGTTDALPFTRAPHTTTGLSSPPSAFRSPSAQAILLFSATEYTIRQAALCSQFGFSSGGPGVSPVSSIHSMEMAARIELLDDNRNSWKANFKASDYSAMKPFPADTNAFTDRFPPERFMSLPIGK